MPVERLIEQLKQLPQGARVIFMATDDISVIKWRFGGIVWDAFERAFILNLE